MQQFSVVVIGRGGCRKRVAVTASGIEDAAHAVAADLYGTRGVDAGVYRTSGDAHGTPGYFRAYTRCGNCRRMAQGQALYVEGVGDGN